MQDSFGINEALEHLGIKDFNNGVSTGSNWSKGSEGVIKSYSPADGNYIGSVGVASKEEYNQTIEKAQEAFVEWRKVPAPKRGEIVRQIGDELRKHKESLGKLVSY